MNSLNETVFNLSFPEPIKEVYEKESDTEFDDLDSQGPYIPKFLSYSDMFLLKVPFVPDSFRNFMIEKGKQYEANGYGYAKKDYSTPYAAQVEINSNADEATCCSLLANIGFCQKINEVIKSAPFPILTKDGTQLTRVSGNYTYNTNHGEGNHDIPSHFTEELEADRPKTYIDLLRSRTSRYDKQAIWSIEVKSNTINAAPTKVHNADLVFLHLLATDTIIIYASPLPRGQRTDQTYQQIGTVSGFGQWYNIEVASNWELSRME